MKIFPLFVTLLLLLAPAFGHAENRDARWREKQEETQHKERLRAKRQAFKQHRAEARKGYAESYYLTAYDYYTGAGVAKNLKKARRYARKAYKAGDERGGVFYAQLLSAGAGGAPDYETAYQIFTELAPYRPDAAYGLARLYANDQTPYADEKQALAWLTRAAEEGFSPALYDLAERRLTGAGVEKSPQQALALFKKAADQEYLPARLETARLYQEGVGADQNPQQAFYYTYQAAKQNHPLAQWQTAQYFQQGYGTEKSPSLAVFWMKKAARRNVRAAQLELARCYREGLGTRRNLQEAKRWQTRADKNLPVSYEDTQFGY